MRHLLRLGLGLFAVAVVAATATAAFWADWSDKPVLFYALVGGLLAQSYALGARIVGR